MITILAINSKSMNGVYGLILGYIVKPIDRRSTSGIAKTGSQSQIMKIIISSFVDGVEIYKYNSAESILVELSTQKEIDVI
jgi:hypothetical protein